jgi:hypothetical protein
MSSRCKSKKQKQRNQNQERQNMKTKIKLNNENEVASLCNSKTKSKIELLGFSFDSDCLKDRKIVSFFTKSFPKSEYVVVVTQDALGGEDRVSLNAFLARQASGTPSFSCSFASVCEFGSFAATLLPWSRESLRTAQAQ